MSLVKGEVSKAVANVPGIPAEKKAATVETATSSLLGSLKGQLNAKNLPGLLSAFGGGTGSASKTGAIGGSVVKALTDKVGLSPAVAQQIVSVAVPAVMALFSKKVADTGEPGFNVGSLLGALSGSGGGKSSSAGGIGSLLGGLGSLFGKK